MARVCFALPDVARQGNPMNLYRQKDRSPYLAMSIYGTIALSAFRAKASTIRGRIRLAMATVRGTRGPNSLTVIRAQELLLKAVERPVFDTFTDIINQANNKALVVNCGQSIRQQLASTKKMM